MNPIESDSTNSKLVSSTLNTNGANGSQSGAEQPVGSSHDLDVASSRRNNFYGAIVIVLLLLAVVAVYAPRLLNEPALGVTEDDSGFGYVVDLDFWRRTDREKSVRTTARFDLDADLAELPLEIGNWQGQEKPETNREVEILLDPEQYIRRLYQDNESGHYIWLSVIGGRSSQPFHAPDICYDADGWQYSMGSHGFALDNGGELHGLYLDAQKESPETKNTSENKVDHHVVSYFYVFPDGERSLSDGIVLFKLTSGRIGSIDESLNLHENFVQQFFTSAN